MFCLGEIFQIVLKHQLSKLYIASDFLPKINCVCLPTMETVIDETFLYLRHEFVYCGVRSVVGKKVLQTFQIRISFS